MRQATYGARVNAGEIGGTSSSLSPYAQSARARSRVPCGRCSRRTPIAAAPTGRSICAGRSGRLGRGQASAFTELYRLTSARVHGLVLRVVRGPARAAEVTQEVFVDVWTQSARCDGRVRWSV